MIAYNFVITWKELLLNTFLSVYFDDKFHIIKLSNYGWFHASKGIISCLKITRFNNLTKLWGCSIFESVTWHKKWHDFQIPCTIRDKYAGTNNILKIR